MTHDPTPTPAIRERSADDKLRYVSRKLAELHDQLADTTGREHRATLIGLAMQLDWAADAVKAQQEEMERLRSELEDQRIATEYLARKARGETGPGIPHEEARRRVLGDDA